MLQGQPGNPAILNAVMLYLTQLYQELRPMKNCYNSRKSGNTAEPGYAIPMKIRPMKNPGKHKTYKKPSYTKKNMTYEKPSYAIPGKQL